MITPGQDFDGAPRLRKEFRLEEGHGDVVKATLRATALGIYEACINGTPVGEDVLSPGWSSYEWRLRYRTYDVTALVGPRTVIGAELGNGWYRGRLAWHGLSNLYGSELGFLGQLDTPSPSAPTPAGRPARRPPPSTTCTTGRPSTPGTLSTAGRSRASPPTPTGPACVPWRSAPTRWVIRWARRG